MLGQFLEIAFASCPLSASFKFFEALGFTPIPVGDVLRDPYVALFDGRLTVGLHERDGPSPLLTFVRPELDGYARAIRRLGIELEEAHLADDEFNWIGFRDPNGQPIALLEARTFSPADWNPQNVSACGEFLEYSLATDSIARSKQFWQALGLAETAAGVTPHPWVRLAGHGLVLGLHETGFRAGPTFLSPQLDARAEYLRAKGLQIRPNGPFESSASRCATLQTPEGTPIYLLDGSAQPK
jgi:hypothetical protein